MFERFKIDIYKWMNEFYFKTMANFFKQIPCNPKIYFQGYIESWDTKNISLL